MRASLFPIFLSAFALLAASRQASAQRLPIGSWRSFYPYNVSEGIATDGQTIFSAAGLGFLTLDAATGETQTYSKVNGLSDVRTTRVGHDRATGTTIIAYENSNIDLFRSGSFTPIPDLKNKSISGSKRINDIWAENGTAWLSTDVGILVLNMERAEVAETYTFGTGGTSLSVRSFQPAGPWYYAATSQGLFRAPRNSPRLTDFATWRRFGGSTPVGSIAAVGDTLYLRADTGVLRLRMDTDTTGGRYFDTVYRSRSVVELDGSPSAVLVSLSDRVLRLRGDGTVSDSFFVGFPAGAVELADGRVYAANRYGGIAVREGATGSRTIAPNGPAAPTSYDIKANAGRVLVAHGGYSDLFVARGSESGLSILSPDDGRWTVYNRNTYGPMSAGAKDITAVVEAPDGTLYLGSLGDGLQIIYPDGRFERLREGSIIENAYNSGSDSAYNVISLALDQVGNLVVGQFAAIAHELAVRTPGGQWYRYTTPFSTSVPILNSAAGLTIDEANQRWYFAPQGGGVIVYNDGGTPEVPGDDNSRQFLAGTGAGGLPSSAVLSLALDRDGAIWVGTTDGIGIISCASTAVTDRQGCEAERPIVQYDQFAGYLFEGEAVRTIAVDGANRKWIGTTNGVWLISPTGDEVIERFTAENSPLPSNVIQQIAVDGVTGEVYIGTDAGLLSYRGTATEGGETNDEILAFPNPVPSGYRGTIAVRGLTENADVRITDIAGQLVYRTKALGGQAVWNGMDYTGKRPQSGVYLVFATNSDGTQAGTGKIVFME